MLREALINYPVRGIEPEFAVDNGKFAQRSLLFIRSGHRLSGRTITATELSSEEFAWFDPRIHPALHKSIEMNLNSNGGPKAFRVRYVASDLVACYLKLFRFTRTAERKHRTLRLPPRRSLARLLDTG
jgi:hypothetical protein